MSEAHKAPGCSNNHKDDERQDGHQDIHTTSTETHRKRKRDGVQKKQPKHEQRQKLQRKQEQQGGGHPSIQALLSVPLKYILRKTSNIKINKVSSNHSHDRNIKNTANGKRKKEQLLLSKIEASAFIQLSNLAHEIDVLLYMLSSALHKSHVTKELSRLISTPRPTPGNSGNNGGGNNVGTASASASSSASNSTCTTIPTKNKKCESTSSISNSNSKNNNNNAYNYYLHPPSMHTKQTW